MYLPTAQSVLSLFVVALIQTESVQQCDTHTYATVSSGGGGLSVSPASPGNKHTPTF